MKFGISHPPIYVGGGSEQTFARIGEYGDAWLANSPTPEELGPRIDRLREVTGRETPVTVFGAPARPEVIEGYAALGVERVLLSLPTLPEKDSVDHLDRLAALAHG